MYHVMSRGNRRQDIYLDDVDRQDFLKTLAEACQKTAWQVHAYCLMSNHDPLAHMRGQLRRLSRPAVICGSTQTIQPNDRLFLLRQGSPHDAPTASVPSDKMSEPSSSLAFASD